MFSGFEKPCERYRSLSQPRRAGQAGIRLHGELINSLITQNKKQADTFNQMEKALAYISEILSLQQTYASREEEAKELVDLNDLMGDAIRMQMGALEKRRIFVKKQFDDRVPKLLIDKNRLMQVIVNFIKNSQHRVFSRP